MKLSLNHLYKDCHSWFVILKKESNFSVNSGHGHGEDPQLNLVSWKLRKIIFINVEGE